jgi:hypothetical protein
MNATITLTQEETAKLSSLLGILNGSLQYMAMQDASGELDEHWAFWSVIQKKIAASTGISICVSSKETEAILGEYVKNANSLVK